MEHGASGDAAAMELLGAPLVFAPTAAGFGVSAVVRTGNPAALDLEIQTVPGADWTTSPAPVIPAADVAQWNVTGLAAGRRVPYRLLRHGSSRPLYVGSAQTARPPGQPFTFALIADTHLEPRDPVPPGTTVVADAYGAMEQTMLQVMPAVHAVAPDFLLNLGDLLDYHLFGFNAPPPNSGWARLGYLNYRRLLGDAAANAAHFTVLGNWDGESGCNTAAEIARSTSQRLSTRPARRRRRMPRAAARTRTTTPSPGGTRCSSC